MWWCEHKCCHEVSAKLDKLRDELEEVESELLVIASLLKKLTQKPVAKFLITGALMNINPGQSTVLTATPQAADGSTTTLPAGDVPTWAVSDPTKVTVSPSVDGLSLKVTVNAGAAPGDIIFSITDQLIATATGTFTLTVPAVGPKPVASFSVTASTPV